MKVLIIGGGMAGVAFASFLRNQPGMDITLVEKAHHWGDVGYAVALWGNGRRMLQLLGAEHEVMKNGYEVPWIALLNKHATPLSQFFMNIFVRYGPMIVTTRTNLHQALIKTLEDKTKILFGTTVQSLVQEPQGVTVTLSTGVQEHFDLVIGADGIHSTTRETVFGPGHLKPYGWTVWAFWTPPGFASPRGAVEFSSVGSLYTVYPMADRAVIMLFSAKKALDPQPPAKTREKLREVFADFKGSVGHLIDAIEDPEHIFHDELRHVDLADWYKGRVALMGDAQHATSPITGMGTSLALEDAYVLADELKKITSVTQIGSALAHYAHRRQHRIRAFHRAAYLIENWTTIKSPLLAAFRDLVIPFLPINFFMGPIEKLIQEEI